MFEQLVETYSYHELKAAERTLRESINAHTKHGFCSPDIAARWMDNYQLVTDRIVSLGYITPAPLQPVPNPVNPNNSYEH